MEYQLQVKVSASGIKPPSPGEIILGLFEGRIKPDEYAFELVDLPSGTFNNIHEHSSLSVPPGSEDVSNGCNPSAREKFEFETVESSVNSKVGGSDNV